MFGMVKRMSLAQLGLQAFIGLEGLIGLTGATSTQSQKERDIESGFGVRRFKLDI